MISFKAFELFTSSCKIENLFSKEPVLFQTRATGSKLPFNIGTMVFDDIRVKEIDLIQCVLIDVKELSGDKSLIQELSCVKLKLKL